MSNLNIPGHNFNVFQPKLKDTSTGSTAGKKPVRSKTKPLYFWTSADVNKWLKKHGGHCHELYGELLLEEEVTGKQKCQGQNIV